MIYAICLIAAFGLGFNAFQGNMVAGSMQDSFGIDRVWTGIALAAISGFIIFGGIHRIAKVSDVVVPIMAIGYLAMALIVILLNITSLPGVIYDIVTNAFGLQEAVGGGMGAAVAQGLRRGLFSNEAGLGSAPNVAATAEVRHPISQGITQSFSVFIDTIIICSCTAFVILLGDVYVPGAEGIDGVALTQQSMVSHLGTWVQYFLSGAILLFSFSSIIYNYYLGENAMTVLTKSPLGILGLRIAIIAIVFLGATAPAATAVFFFSDPMMGILALVNLLAIMMLFPVAMRLLRDFRRQLKAGVERPVLNPDDYADLDIDRDAWNPPAECSGRILPEFETGRSICCGPFLLPPRRSVLKLGNGQYRLRCPIVGAKTCNQSGRNGTWLNSISSSTARQGLRGGWSRNTSTRPIRTDPGRWQGAARPNWRRCATRWACPPTPP